MNPGNPSNTTRLRLILLAVVTIAAGSILYRSSLLLLANTVMNREGSSHGIFVPFLSAFFIWINREILRKTEIRYDPVGIPVVLAGLLFPMLRIDSFELQSLGFIIFLSGAVILLLGRKCFKVVAFPLLFLVTMVPIPDDTYSKLADSTRIISFGGSRWILSMLGIPFVRDGNVISLPNVTLVVAEGCSGIRYLISFLVFSLAYAYLFRSKLSSRIAIVFSSVVISLMASVMRLTSIFVLAYYVSPRLAEAKPHVVISWIVFFVFLVVAVGLDQHFQSKKAGKLESQDAGKVEG
jgi:exosortase